MNRRGFFVKTIIYALPLLMINLMLLSFNLYGQTEIAKLLPDDGDGEDSFGTAVAISGDAVIIGASFDEPNGWGSGSAYIFRFNGSQWFQEQKLTPSDGTEYDYFGGSVAIDGDIAVVGADGTAMNRGAAYVFKYTGAQWIEQQKLEAGDGSENDMFGSSVDIDGDAIIVGAMGEGLNKGAAYIYRLIGNSWIEEGKLTVSDGFPFAYLGCSVGISNNIPFVGARGDFEKGNESGAAYIFQKDGTVWIRTAKLFPEDGQAGEKFGASVSIDGDVAAAGSRFCDLKDIDAGAVNIFRRQGNQWMMEYKIAAGDGKNDDRFGYVAVDGNYVVVGADHNDELGINAGAAYLFKWDGSDWEEMFKLVASDGFAEDWFGSAVDINNGIIVIGAPQNNDKGNSSGSAYIFRIDGTNDNYNTLINENFEGMIFPPPNWSIDKQNAQATWEKYNSEELSFTRIKGSSNYSAYCWWSDASSDEWLISPQFNLGGGKSYLSFYSLYSSSNLGYSTLRLNITTDNGQNWSTIWEAEDDDLSWRWRKTKIDLSPLANMSNIKLAWQYYGQSGGAMAVDAIVLKSEGGTTDISERQILPNIYTLSSNYPNPFNPVTVIKYTIPESGKVSLRILNILGEEIKTLINKFQPAGRYSVRYTPEGISSGVYFYELIVNDFRLIRKMSYIK